MISERIHRAMNVEPGSFATLAEKAGSEDKHLTEGKHYEILKVQPIRDHTSKGDIHDIYFSIKNDQGEIVTRSSRRFSEYQEDE